MDTKEQMSTPPIAKKSPKRLEKHGDVRIDDYYWMRLSDDQKVSKIPDTHTQNVLNYLNDENNYRKSKMAHLQPLQDELYQEIIARIKQNDQSVPYKSNGYIYQTIYRQGQEHPIYLRKKDNSSDQFETLLDVNHLAKPHSYYHISSRTVSPNNKIVAYGEDTLSRRQYTLKFKNIETEELYPDEIPNTTGRAIWANDNETIFYVKKNDALRSYKICRHQLGTNPTDDIEVFHEADETFNTFVSKTKSKKYIIIGSHSTLSSEYRILNANTPQENFSLFSPRYSNLEYSIYHHKESWYIYTNKDEAFNFKIMKTSEINTNINNWKEFIPHRANVFIESLEIFENHFAINERIDGLRKIKIIQNCRTEHYIKFDEQAYSSFISINPDFNTNLIRLVYTSMTTPQTTFDYNMETQTLNTLKVEEVIGKFDKNLYKSESKLVKDSEGTLVPLSIVYRKDLKKNKEQPLLLYGYGSYGISTDPYFSSVRLSLLDRGFIFAIAHIRGGQENGRMWYENGKFLKKKNTFSDFILCAEYLVKNKYTSHSQLFAMGGSAGGLLMGAVINIRPDLWKGVIAEVPFVDVLTTMLDESIPLTTGEYEEWGNPNEIEYYNYIKSYSPYDNIKKQDYPSILVTTGFHDSQVQYWEPAKWVAKLRDYKTDDNIVIMYCNMKTGHGGSSGRFEKYKEKALEYAFILNLVEGSTNIPYQNGEE